MLQLHDWNLDRALGTFFNNKDRPDGEQRTRDVSDDEGEDWASLMREHQGLQNRHAPPARNARSMSPAPVAALPAFAPPSKLQAVADWLSGAPAPVDPRRPFADVLAASLRERHAAGGVALPEFARGRFEDVLTDVARGGANGSVLVAYLHAPLNPHSEAFCLHVLGDPELARAVAPGTGAVLWGGSVEAPEGYEASEMLQLTGYPGVAVLASHLGRPTVFARLCYRPEPPGFVARLLDAIDGARAAARAQPAPASRDDEERRRLISEQDAALKRAIEEDRARVEKRERDIAAAEEARAREEAERAREAAERAELTRRAQSQLEAKRARIRPEPAKGDAATTTLRIQLPGGSRLQRRFLASDSLQQVRDVVDVHLAESNALAHWHYAIESNFPKVRYDDDAKTLDELGLGGGQALLYVIDLEA